MCDICQLLMGMGEPSELSNVQENVIIATVIERSRYAYWTYFNDVLRLMNWMFYITNGKQQVVGDNIKPFFRFIESFLEFIDMIWWNFRVKFHYTPDTAFQLTSPFNQRNSLRFDLCLFRFRNFPKLWMGALKFWNVRWTHMQMLKNLRLLHLDLKCPFIFVCV